MKHTALISGFEVRSNSEFIVYSPLRGIVAEAGTLEKSRRLLEEDRHTKLARNTEPDLAIFRWMNDRWAPALSLYELQESHLAQNPSAVIHFP
jgi:hypothetical protein